MDPNATLLQIREAVTNNDFETAAQLFDGLDHWLTCGGFLPSSWDWSTSAVKSRNRA